MSSHITDAAPSADGRTWAYCRLRRSRHPYGDRISLQEGDAFRIPVGQQRSLGAVNSPPVHQCIAILLILSSHWSSSQANCPRHDRITHPPSNRLAPNRPSAASLNCGERKDHRNGPTAQAAPYSLPPHSSRILHQEPFRLVSWVPRSLGQGEVDCPTANFDA